MNEEPLGASNRELRDYEASLFKSVREATEAPLAQIAQQVADAQAEVLRNIAAPILEGDWLSADLRETMERTQQALREHFERVMPPNFAELDIDVFSVALEMSGSGGPCVVWAPRREIIEELVACATFDERGAVLSASRADVLNDVREILSAASTTAAPIQQDLHRLATSACLAAIDGHDDAAQALAAAGLGSVIHDVLGHQRFAPARAQMATHDLQEAAIDEVRYLTLRRATANAITPTRESPEGFNRHGTLHGNLSAYNEATMLSAVLLLAGWVRELSWWAENHPEVFQTGASNS
jgi:hypothetical protein